MELITIGRKGSETTPIFCINREREILYDMRKHLSEKTSNMNSNFATLVFLLVAVMAGWQMAMAAPEPLPEAAPAPEALAEADPEAFLKGLVSALKGILGGK